MLNFYRHERIRWFLCLIPHLLVNFPRRRVQGCMALAAQQVRDGCLYARVY